MKKKIILLFIMVFITKLDIKALTYGGCDYSSISRLKSLVTNINISYDYYFIDNTPYFNVTLNNITQDMSFIDTLTNKTYTYYDTNSGEITITGYTGDSGSYKFYSNLGECQGISIGTKYYKFPSYNRYYNTSLCSDIPNYSLCQKWVSVDYSYEKFESLINEYKNKKPEENPVISIDHNKNIFDMIVDFYVNYYYYILISIIVICSSIIIVKRRNNKFDL